MAAKRLLIFGGTFDPPHNGHMALLQNAAARVKPDKILVLPDYMPPHKAKATCSAEERLAMCQCFAQADSRVVVDDRELRRGGKSYTVDTVRELRKTYRDWHFYFVLGSDMLLSFETWREWQTLLKEMTLVCQSRQQGLDEAIRKKISFLREYGGHVIFCDAPPIEISSTFLRERIKKKQDIAAFVPQTVLHWLQETEKKEERL